MADITKANDVEPTSQDKDKKKKKKRVIIGVTLGVATAGVVVAAVLGARGCSDTNVNVNYGVENMKQQSNKNIQISVPTGTTDMEGFTWHEEKDLAFNQETISQMNLDSNTIKLEQDKYDYRMNHSEVVADAHKMGKGTMTIDVYKKGTAPTAQKLSNDLADKASSDEAFDAPVIVKPLFTKTINLTVSFIGRDEATKNISDQLKDPKFSYPAGEVKDPIKAPITIPTNGKASASKDLTPDLGASIGLDIPVGSVLPTYTVKSDGGDHSVGTMTITNDGHTTDIKITSGITSTTVTTPKAPVAKTPEEIAAEKAATKAAEEKTKQDAITAAADKARQDAADKLAAAASAKDAAKQATQDQLKALPVPTGFPTATDKTLPDYISAKTEFDTALADFNTAQANGDLDKAQDALAAAKTAKHEAETAITKAQQVKDNLDAELALLTPPKAPGTPTGVPTAEYTKAKADYDAALVDFNAKKAAFDLDGAKAAKVTAETVAATANKHLSADPSVVFAALGTMEALPTNMPTPIPTDIQTLVDEYNAADTDFNALLATPDMANVDKATQDLKTGSVKVAAIKKLIADEAAIKALATPKTFPAELKTLPADFKAEETKYNAAKTAFDGAVAAKDPIEAKKQLLLLDAAADKATLLNTHVTDAIAALGALPTLPASTGKTGNERDEYNTAKTDYATAKAAFDAAIANDDVATATTSLADATTAVKLASANLDPKTMPVTVYTYDGKEYATQVLALAAAKTGEEAKITEKTIYKLAGTTFDSKADADDALKAAADKTIKTQTWAAGTAPTDGSAAPAATVQDTVYVFNGQAFETEAQAQAAWLVANPGAPEVEGTFDVMYDGTKVKSFTIGSADKDKYKDEATALAEAKTKFAYVKGTETGVAAQAAGPAKPVTKTYALGDKIKVDGEEYTYSAGTDPIKRIDPLSQYGPGIHDITIDGVDKKLVKANNGHGTVTYRVWLDDDNYAEGSTIDELIHNIDPKTHTHTFHTTGTDLVIMDASIMKELKTWATKMVANAGGKFPALLATPGRTDYFNKFLKPYIEDVAAEKNIDLPNDFFDGTTSGADMLVVLKKLFKDNDDITAFLSEGVNNPFGIGPADFIGFIANNSYSNSGWKMYNASRVTNMLNRIIDFANKNVNGALFQLAPALLVPVAPFDQKKVLETTIPTSIRTKMTDICQGPSRLWTSLEDLSGQDKTALSEDKATGLMSYKNNAAKAITVIRMGTDNFKDDAGHELLIVTGMDIDNKYEGIYEVSDLAVMQYKGTFAIGATPTTSHEYYMTPEGEFFSDRDKIPGYPSTIAPVWKGTTTLKTLPTVYVKDGTDPKDNDYVTDQTKAATVAAVPESRVEHYTLEFDGVKVSGQDKDLPWKDGDTVEPTMPTIGTVTIDKFKAYVPDTTNTISNIPSTAITSEAITAGFDGVKAAGDTGVDETTLTKVSGGFSGVVMDGKFYTDQAAAEAAYATAHATDITTEQIKTMFDGKDLKTEADATKAADAKAVTEVTSTSKDVPYVAASSDEPLIVQTFTLDTTNIYA